MSETTDGFDISIDTTGMGNLRGSIDLQGPTGTAVIAIDVELLPQAVLTSPTPPPSKPPHEGVIAPPIPAAQRESRSEVEDDAEGTILLARDPAMPMITSAPLPESLRIGMDSPHPGIRIGAMTELGEWLASDDPGRAATARQHLQEIADNDIPRVAQIARNLLDTGTAAEPAAPTWSRAATSAPPLPLAPIPVLTPPSRLAYTLTGHTSGVLDVAFSPDGRLLATASADGTARLWDPAIGDSLRTLTGCTFGARGVAFSPDGRLLATSGTDGTTQMGDRATSTGEEATQMWDPASGNGEGTIRLWDPATGDSLRTLTDHTVGARGVAFSPDGRLLATASADGTALLWDPASGDSLRTLTGHDEEVIGVTFSPDGRLLATASADETVRLWN